jgi:hypothetical protein
MSGSADFDVTYTITAFDAVRHEGQWGSTPFTFRVLRAGKVGQEQTMNWGVVTEPGMREADSADFTGATSGQITFGAGVTERFITVSVVGDTIREFDERFFVALSFGPGEEIGIGTTAAQGFILADEPTITVTPNQAGLAEGDSGITRFTYTATRSGSLDAWDWVDWNVAGSGARPADGWDFAGGVAPWGRAAFAPGQRTTTITVDVVGDTVREGDEEFRLNLVNPSAGVALATTSLTSRILADEPTVGIASQGVIATEGQWGTRPADFVVFRTGSPDGWAHVDWYVSATGEVPADGTDFAGGVMPWGRAVFAPGQSQATISIALAGDTLREGDETFRLNLVNPSAGLELAQPTATATIRADEPTITAVGSWNWRAEGQSGSTPLLFTALRDSGLDSWDWVDWYVTGSGGRPADAADFAGGVLPWGRAVFAPGLNWASIDVWVNGDTVFEGDEELTLHLVKPSPGAVLGTTSLTGRILADEPTVSVVASDSWRAEGNGGSTPFIFTAIREGDLSGWAHADWLAVGTGANPASNDDFAGGLGAWGRAVFAPGQKWATITVDVAGDTLGEPMEAFDVVLTRASAGLAITTASAGGRILSDDATVSVIAPNAALAEAPSGTTPFRFTVTRSGDLAPPASVGWSVVGSGASPADAADFGGTLPSGTVQFAAGQASRTVTVNLARDGAFEGIEGFAVLLSDPSPSLSVAMGRAEATILGDVPTLSLARAVATRTEGGSGIRPFTFTVTLDAPRATATEVDWKVAGLGPAAANAADFEGGVLPGGRVAIAAGATSATISVPVQGDRTAEADERFTVTLSNPSAGVRIGAAKAEGVIKADDTVISIAAVTPALAEGGGTDPAGFAFLVTRSGKVDRVEAISWTVSGSGSPAATEEDFLGGFPSGSLVFQSGETAKTLRIPFRVDADPEPHEGFAVTLSGPASGTRIGTSRATATLVDNDDATKAGVSVVAETAQHAEGDGLAANPFVFRFTVSRDSAGSTAEWVDWRVARTDASAATVDAADLMPGTPMSGRVQFAPGVTSQVLEFAVVGDTRFEPDEALIVQLGRPSQGLRFSQAEARTLLVNDDLL